jgi:alkylation response protein AidB-like acyl-CoA dehydrogenase
VNTEQRDLRDAVRGLISRGGDWKRLCAEIGVAGLAIPERYGGSGASAVETGIVMSELGRELVPSPMLGSAVLAAQALLASGDEAACERLLPRIADGTVAALAWTAEAGHWDPTEVAFAADLTGEAHYALDGATAEILLAVTPEGLVEVDLYGPGVERKAVPAMDITRELAVVRMDGASGQRIAGDGAHALAAARDAALVILAAEQTGTAERALEITVEYAKTRVQFGRPIGTFQALQHRMAYLHVLVESARSMWLAAASSGDPMLAAGAKVYCSESLTRVVAEMVQLHGAIGVTWEHPAHRYLKRAHGSALLFGSPGQHVTRIAAAQREKF